MMDREQMLDHLRKLALKYLYFDHEAGKWVITYSGKKVPWRDAYQTCDVCEGTWVANTKELHAEGCFAALVTGADHAEEREAGEREPVQGGGGECREVGGA